MEIGCTTISVPVTEATVTFVPEFTVSPSGRLSPSNGDSCYDIPVWAWIAGAKALAKRLNLSLPSEHCSVRGEYGVSWPWHPDVD